MNGAALKYQLDIKEYLKDFTLEKHASLFEELENNTEVELVEINGEKYLQFINEYWTSKQRLSSSLHEVAYRACFKGQLPRFFIKLLSNTGDVVYDPFSGRGTTAIEAAILKRDNS